MTEHQRFAGGIIHPEGRSLLLGTGAALGSVTALILTFKGYRAARMMGVASLGVVAFLAHFFRYPGCVPPSDPDLIVSPAAGRVVYVGTEHEPEILGDRRLRVSIFLSVLDVHLTRSPIAGRVTYQQYHPGRYLVALHPKSSQLNERNSILLEDANGSQVLVRQIAGFLARRIRSYVGIGMQVARGQEIGFIKLGSRVDLFLPAAAEPLVRVGQAVRAGETPLARWP